jgi:hypothetical protein
MREDRKMLKPRSLLFSARLCIVDNPSLFFKSTPAAARGVSRHRKEPRHKTPNPRSRHQCNEFQKRAALARHR